MSAVHFVNAGPSVMVPIGSVKPHPENPRIADVEPIQDVIRANGFHGSLLVQKSTGFILAGNHRWKALLGLDVTTVPVQFVDVDDATARRILLADNKLGERGGYDEERVAALLKDVQEAAGGSVAGTGYSDGDLSALLARVSADLPPPTRVLGVADAFAALPVGDKEPFEQMTFTLHTTQAAVVRAAMDALAAGGGATSLVNANRNGNLLAAVCAKALG